jgi:small conductance mechanosensitive channel
MAFGVVELHNLSQAILTIGSNVLVGIVILVVGIWLAKYVARLLFWVFSRQKLDATISLFIKKLLYYSLVIGVVLIALTKFGVDSSSFLVVFGTAGIAIGFALRAPFSNLASGVLLVMFRPYRVGQFIEIGAYQGYVIEINLLYSQLRTPAHELVHVPNSLFMEQYFENYSDYDVRRADVTVNISYDADLLTAKAALQKMLDDHEKVLDCPKKPVVMVKELADSAVVLVCRFYTGINGHWPTVFAVTESVKQCLSEVGIEIPFPQRDIHLKDKVDVN